MLRPFSRERSKERSRQVAEWQLVKWQLVVTNKRKLVTLSNIRKTIVDIRTVMDGLKDFSCLNRYKIMRNPRGMKVNETNS